MLRPIVIPAGCLAALALLAGCSTKTYRAYDGDRLPPEAVATLEVIPEIDVLKIEGRDGVGFRSVMPGRSDRIELLPGTNTIVARYSTIYGTEHDDYDAFYSKSVPLTFVARPGARYRFGHDPVPEDPVRAQTPREVGIWLEQTGGAKVMVVPRPSPPVVEPVVVPDPSAPKTAAPPDEPAPVEETGTDPAGEQVRQPDAEPPAKGDLEALNLLRFWWGRADEEERGAFLRWIEP